MQEPKPFFKWAGGKRQLLKELLATAPPEFNNYYEPFLGGGALFFKLSYQNKINKCYLNDSNSVLINAYRVVKENPDKLIKELTSGAYPNTKENFLKIREAEPTDPIKATARFLYLNRTAFNGLYRVNSKGKFNVPFGKYDNPNICDQENIKAVSEALQKDELTNFDFQEAVNSTKKKDFIYFDPPYAPLNKTSNFTSYTKEDFTEKDQERLAELFKALDKKGCLVMLSNSDAPLIRKLYDGFSIKEVKATRMINCKAKGRGKITELIITNYPQANPKN